jgi:hypothetical protein
MTHVALVPALLLLLVVMLMRNGGGKDVLTLGI